MRRIATRSVMLVVSVACLLFPQALAARDLSFEDRVTAQETIERIRYLNRVDATRPFEVAVPREHLERRVREDLARSVALERHWDRPITAEMLQRELARISAGTRMPERLERLFAALGHDSFLIQETLVRSVLAERLARSSFASDPQIHAEASREAGELRERLRAGDLAPSSSHPARRVTTLLRRDGEELSPETRNELSAVHGSLVLDLDADEFDRRHGASERLGEIGQVVAGDEAFTVSVVLEKHPDRVVLATYSFPRRSWDEWWAERSSDFDGTGMKTAAEDSLALPPVSAGDVPCLGENWDVGGLLEVPLRRTGHTAIWTGSEMIVWGGWIAGTIGGSGSGARYDPTIDSWTAISTIGAPSGRVSHAAVWTGQQMIVWGSQAPFGGGSTNTGGRYDPVTDTWSPTSLVNVPLARSGPVGVWTGSVAVFWGGYASGEPGGACDCCNKVNQNTPGCADCPPCEDAVCQVEPFCCVVVWDAICDAVAGSLCNCCPGQDPGFCEAFSGGFSGPVNSGGRYDPATDTWTPTSLVGVPSARSSHSGVWTGNEMIVWGGYSSGHENTGGRYDPVSDAWIFTHTVGAPTARHDHRAVWTGSEMIVFGGIGNAGYLNTGGRYNPSTGSWMPTSTAGAPPGRDGHTAIWTGDEMIVWGGGPIPPGESSGGRYRPTTDSWTDTALSGEPLPREDHTAIWTGDEMIVWGGSPNDVGFYAILGTGGRYDPASDSWTPTNSSGTPQARAHHTAVWTGNEMIVWGGATNLAKTLQITPTGGRYDPVTHSWSQTSLHSAPGERWFHTAVWTGDEMIVWGGNGYSDELDDGGRYDPLADTWAPTALGGAPSPRRDHSAVWTGSRMIVWGGYGNGFKNDGKLYDPQADSWSPMQMSDAPVGRAEHTAVRAGSRMIVWGGGVSGGYEDTGGLYDPAGDSWVPTSLVGAPEGRNGHTAVWTGSRMIVWGGGPPGSTNSGARYDPLSDSWTPTTTAGAPSPRSAHTAVWTGDEMIVWGTQWSSPEGGRYDPDTDSWTLTTLIGAPETRTDHTAVWTGDRMIVWGGNWVRSDGALYDPDGEDVDGDQHGCAVDCNDNDPTVFGEPFEISGVVFKDDHTLQWPSIALSTGNGTSYDVVRGVESELPVGGGPSEICLAPGHTGGGGIGGTVIKLEDTDEPSSGDVFWYLIRAANSCGIGSYGETSFGKERVTAVCP